MSDDVIVFSLLVSYKAIILGVGLAFSYMGYKLFMADKIAHAGDFDVSAGKYEVSLRGGAPGVYFSLFGTVLICISIFKGIEFNREPYTEKTKIEKIVPDLPPF